MLSYYVERHMRQALAPILFDDDDKEAAKAARESIVAKAQRSPKALRKALQKKTEDGSPVHSFQSLLKDLATLTRNTIRFGKGTQAPTFEKLTSPTPTQQKALELLGVKTMM